MGMSKERKFRVILDTGREKKKHFGRGVNFFLQSVALKSVCVIWHSSQQVAVILPTVPHTFRVLSH